MKSLLKWTAWLILALVVLVVLAGSLGVFALSQFALPSDMVLTVDGESVALQGMSGGALLMAGGGVLLAVLLVLIIVPLALLFGLGVPLLLCVGGLLLAVMACGAALLLVASPVIAVVLLVAWLLRPRRGRADLPSAT